MKRLDKLFRSTPPVQADDLIGAQDKDHAGDPIAMELFKSATPQAPVQKIPHSTLSQPDFNPHSPEFEYIKDPTTSTTNVDYYNSARQPLWEKSLRASKQFGANVVSSIGQGLANTFDMISFGKTIKGEVTGSDDNFDSSLFGLSVKDMQDWSNGIAQRNRIYRENPGSVNLGDFGWWAEQFASSGTGVGMALEALGTTVAIEFATGGEGTGIALAKLGRLFSRAKNLNYLKEGLDIASGLKSAATLYGAISRYSESRMEASQSYDEIYNDLASQKNPDGTDKFSDEQKKYLASEGARRTFNGNLLLMPLDILAYRAMVFNPVSGAGEGLIEKLLGKIGNKALRTATQFGTEAFLEGTEEGFQYIAQQEGKQYAKVLSGMDDGTQFLERAGKDVTEDEFWNNFAGGVLGSPIIGGAMKLTNRAMMGNRAGRLNDVHANYIKNVAKMDSVISDKIKQYEAAGKTKEASILRRQFGANKALSALHLDALTDKESGFESYKNFLEGTLEELDNNKTDALVDLGFNNPTAQQIETIKREFKQSLADANELKSIYDSVKGKYNKNFLPEIAHDHFVLNRLREDQSAMSTFMADVQKTLPQYNDLSATGKLIYDIEHKLTALQKEKARLLSSENDTNEVDTKIREEILDSVNKRLVETSTRLKEVQQDEGYTSVDKELDNDILRSALRSVPYTNAVYQNEYLTNSVSQKRKEIAAWDNPEYIKIKNKESIKKAKTKVQVEETEKDLNSKNQNTPEVQAAIKEKKDQIAAENAAQVIREQQQEQERSAEVPGNSNLFGEESAIIDNIRQETLNGSKVAVDDEAQNQREPEFLFSPAEFDFNKASDEAKNNIINGIRGLLEKLGTHSSFEDLVRHIIRVQGEKVADEIYNAVKFGWEKVGMAPVDYDAVYEKIFGDPMKKLLIGFGQAIQTTEQLEQQSKKVEEQDLPKQDKPETFDNNNQPVYVHKGVVTMAFVTSFTDLIQTKNPDGTVAVSDEYSESELNTTGYVDSLPLLDPDSFNEGTELEIRVPANFNDIKIPVYNADGSKGKSVTFGQYVAEKNLSPEMAEYQDKIPMIIYRKGASASEKGLAFVHDIGWYHKEDMANAISGWYHKEDMANAISSTRDIRKAVVNSVENSVPVIITGKRQTTFAGLKTGYDQTVTLKEANPETKLTVALTTDSLSTNKKDTLFPNNDTVLINNSPFNVGDVYEVRRFGVKDGKPSFVALPVLRPELDEEAKVTVLQALNIYANRSNVDQQVRSTHDPVIKHINEVMGLDIRTPQGMEQYLRQFITTFNVDKAKTNEDVEAQAKAKLPIGIPYLAFIAGGNIVFGVTGEAAYVDKAGNKKYSYFINPNIAAPKVNNVAKFNSPKMLGWFHYNVHLDSLNRDKPVVMIDKGVKTSVVANSYNDYLLSKLKTNIRSYNIGSDEKPNYVTNIQPIITYELKSKLQQQQQTNEQVKDEIVPKESQEINQEGNQQGTDLSELERQILEQAQKDLGSDFGITKGSQDLFSPAELTEHQREVIASNINRIAGLTPDQQFDIVNFMFNQITSMVNLENTVVTRKDIDNTVQQTFDAVVMPLKRSYEAKIKELNQLLETNPNLKNSSIPDVIKDYQYRANKIENIFRSFNVLKEEAYNRVLKYTGITEDRVENEDINIPDDTAEQDVDFWTEILSESPDNKLTYAMRRFFGQVREKTKSGENATGFLGLPTYVGSDVVIRTLMVTLADVPSDFNTMIAKLETRKEAIPWMQEVIDKLKGADVQKKNQFVTVMSNTSLRMKFTMISYNRRTNSWTTKVYDTNLNGVANAVKESWRAGFYDSNLTIVDDEGKYQLNKVKARSLMDTFEGWKGINLKEVQSDLNLERGTIDKIKNNNPTVTITATGELLKELTENLVTNSDRMRFSMKGQNFQIKKSDKTNQYEISYLKQTVATKESVDSWLREFGIVLSPSTLNELFTKGMYHNYTKVSPEALFTTGNTNGLFGILYNKLKILVNKDEHDFTEYGDSPLDESVISSLANVEAKYNNVNTPFGFRDNGKSLFALTAPKFITDRVRDLKTVDSAVRQQLLSTSFSKSSLWLQLLSDHKFNEKFQVAHMGLNAFKELGKKLYRDNSLVKLSDMDHELTKLGMFWDTTQGEVSYLDKEGKVKSEYPDTSVKMRMATMFSPTMSDKSLMTLITTAVLNLQNKDLLDGNGASQDVIKILYEQTVKPELMRMIKFYQNGGKTNISSYDKGAGIFMLMPEMNNIEYSSDLKLIDAIKHEPNHFTLQYIEGNNELMNKINEAIGGYVTALTNQKMKVWAENGYFENKEGTTEIENLKYFDKKYTDRFIGTPNQKARMAAMDFVINSLVANANSFMTMAGDPAMYFKSSATDPVQQAKDSFVNVGKRLAAQIAPGTTLANSEGEKYIQLHLNDRKATVNNIDYLEEILGKEAAAPYRDMKEGTDAQEYTTWKEHLDILTKLGKTPETLIDITPEEIQQARELFSSDVTKAQLTDKQKALIGKVLQPLKPVYTGQVYDAQQDVMRTIYIKSSSFPLIPQLTAGMEIDKLRDSMEKLQAKHKMNVRTSYQSANKVGSVNTPANVWKEDGTIDDEALKNLDAATLVLDRKNFRIQQEVPFKSGKNKEDKITLGTQLMKLLFGDEILNHKGFMYNGKEYTGKELHEIYNTHFINLVNEKRSQLFSELGLDERGLPINAAKSMARLQAILKDEAINRGYPLQDIQGLTLVNGEFNLPLWASSNSNRYESMLNSIISNRIVRMKFPGNSYVVGSEEGFRVKDDLSGIDQSKIIFTSSWSGKELQGTRHANGELKTAQVLVASKFRDNEGKLIDLFTKENGEYKYIVKTDAGFRLKENMFEKELLKLSSFRIPTSGLQSASSIEIVGFLPHTSADLMIVPKGFTKQKGLDFDIDKENTYQLWHYMTDEGKFEVLDERHRTRILVAADKEVRSGSEGKFLAALMGDKITYTPEEIAEEKFLTKVSSKVTEKLMQNEIIKITGSVLSNSDPKVQAKIARTLNTDFVEAQAEFISSLTSGKEDKYWTPLSDEYQKQKMFLGASGKIGTGAYSLDVVGHSLFQQLALNGEPITLVELVGEGDDATLRPKTWKFGSIESTGRLGEVKTLDGGRTISEVQGERQNMAVDNEKLQVMGRVNVNDITMDVDKVFNMLGFDKGSDGNSISFLFLSQPIIKEYVKRMKNANSNMAEFEVNKEARIVNDLLSEFDGSTQEDIDDEYWNSMSKQMTNENFIQAIKSDAPDGKLQGAVLRRFMEMKQYGIAIRSIQTSINTDSKGLGKSFFDVIEKRNALNRLGMDTNMIIGASALIGDYIPKDAFERAYGTPSEQATNPEAKDYVDIGQFYVKPTTLSGAFNIHGVNTAYNLWSKFFPFDAEVTSKAFSEVLSIIGKEEMSDSKTVELKQNIFQGMKKYFSSSKFNGIINSEDNINAERARLFIDTKDNVSLAKYLKTLKERNGNVVVNTFIKTNKLLNRFEFDIQKNGQPSLIKFNNASGEEFDEQYLYESLSTLIEIRGKDGKVELPQVGNKKYTLDTLAQDLIAYCYLGNAIQEAIQFTKYVPVSYLNQVGYSAKMRAANNWLHSNPNILGAKVGMATENNQHLISEFAMQFIQHNPERVAAPWKWSVKDLSTKTVKIDDNSFYLKSEDKPTFISVYDNSIPKGEKKFRLYWFDGEKYVRIPVLGTFGMDEYQPQSGVGTSLVNGRVRLEANPQGAIQVKTEGQITSGLFSISSGSARTVLQSIADNNTTKFTDLAKKLLEIMPDVKIEIADIKFFGLYNPNEKKILINKSITGNNEKLAETVIHEVVHALTFDHVDQYVSTDPKDGLAFINMSHPDAPAYISELVRLFNHTRNLSGKTAQELKDLIDKINEGRTLSSDEKGKMYGLTNIHEFMTMALTDRRFQEALNKIPYKSTGVSFLEKFKEIVGKILTAMGMKFDENFTAAHAISTIFEVIEGANSKVEEDNAYGYMYDESINTDNFDDFIDGSETEASFSPSEFPNKSLNIITENCL